MLPRFPKKNKENSKLEVSKSKPSPFFKWVIISIALLLLIGVLIYFYPFQKKAGGKQTQDVYLNFLTEIYGKIQKNYWKKISEAELTNLYKLSAEKITKQPQNLEIKNKAGLETMLAKIIAKMDESQRKKFAVNLAAAVLSNLEPRGRSGLYSQKQEIVLRNKVNNIDPQTNLYQILGVSQNAPISQIAQNYQQTSQKLKQILQNPKSGSQEKKQAQKKLKQTKRAYETLGNAEDKKNYDQKGIESAVNSKIIPPNIFYIRLKKLSPTSFEEFQRKVKNAGDANGLDTLILDLRGNLGGSIDLLQWFLGPFIGNGQYAYDFFHQGERKPFKTKTGRLPSLARYKKTVILIDNQTQSSAEVMAAALKKYNVGVLVGTPTKGWGTVEHILPLKNQIDPAVRYSIFLVTNLTLRDDNQPIEGRGVEPTINIKDKNWESQLRAYFNRPNLIKTIKKIFGI